MAIGDIRDTKHKSFEVQESESHHNYFETSSSFTSKAKDEKRDQERESKAYGPKGMKPYGGDALVDGDVYVFELQDDTVEATGSGGTLAYTGRTTALEARARADGEADLDLFDDGKLEVRGAAQAEASLFRSTHGVEYTSPVVQYAGQDVLWAEARGNGEAFVGARASADARANLSFSNKMGVGAEAGAFAGAMVSGELEARGHFLGASAGYRLSGEAWAGGQAWAEVSIGAEGLHASVGAFAGAVASGTAGGDFMGVGAEVTGEAWAGVGAEAEFSATWEDGEIVISAEAGAALGVGGGVGVALTLDTNQMIHDGTALLNTLGAIADDVVEDVAEWAQDTAEGAGEWVEDTAEGVEDTAEEVIEWVEDTAEAIADFFNW